MKTYLLATVFKTVTILILCAGYGEGPIASAQQIPIDGQEPPQIFDHVINSRGESRISLFTGIPVIGSTEYAYGLSDRLTVGVLGGTTPAEEAIGVRFRTVLYERPDSYRCISVRPLSTTRKRAGPHPIPGLSQGPTSILNG